jgi:hypothetical protein
LYGLQGLTGEGSELIDAKNPPKDWQSSPEHATLEFPKTHSDMTRVPAEMKIAPPAAKLARPLADSSEL